MLVHRMVQKIKGESKFLDKIGYVKTSDSKSTDRMKDYRGYKVTDQIIKGFMIYKSGKNLFVAKNESGEEYEGTLEDIKKKIDAYWVKRDEDVMKQKVRDNTYLIESNEYKAKNDYDAIKQAYKNAQQIKMVNNSGNEWNYDVYLNNGVVHVKVVKIRTEDATNYMGEKVFRTYEAWRRACKQINPNVVFEGDKDICQAKPGIGEWDGNTGIIYTKDYYTRNTRFRIKGDKLPLLKKKAKDILKKDSLPLKKSEIPDDQFDPIQLKMGIEVEKEHTDDPEIAKAISKAHLSELPDYYTRLAKMESEAAEVKDGGPGSGIKGHTTARPVAEKKGKGFIQNKEHAKMYINAVGKNAKRILGVGFQPTNNGFALSGKGSLGDKKTKLIVSKLGQSGFKKVDFDQVEGPDGTRNTSVFKNPNGDKVQIVSHYGEKSYQNAHSIFYVPKFLKEAKEKAIS